MDFSWIQPTIYTIQSGISSLEQSLINPLQAGVSTIEQDVSSLIWKPLQNAVNVAVTAANTAVRNVTTLPATVINYVEGAATGAATGAAAVVGNAERQALQPIELAVAVGIVGLILLAVILGSNE